SLLSLAGAARGADAPQPAAAGSPPVRLTAQQDHQRLMALLNIKELRPGANGLDRSAPNAANYDETKANPYPTLPDPLLLNNGKKVTTAKTWRRQRRPELLEAFDRELYGRAPRRTPRVRWEVAATEQA